MYALEVFNAKTTHIEGNTIGLNYAEDAAIPNRFGIIVNNSSDTEIFGFANVIAGNLQQGMQIVGQSSNTFVGGNFIGVNREGSAFGNGLAGILVMLSNSTTIGSDGLARNTIAHNGGDGIELRSSLALVEGNLIYRNGELGIDVSQSPAQFGVTPNDADEGDGNQNFPVITDVNFPETGKVRIEGYVITKPSEEVQLRIYGNEMCDPSGHGEGQVFLDMRAVDTDESGLAEFAFDSELPSAAVAGPLLFYTTTAYTETYGSSEFSACHAPYSVYLPLIMR